MTTTYKETVDITQPNAKLLDFAVSSPDALGVNVYGAADKVEIGQGDVGPTVDSGILLQGEPVGSGGSHHVHDVKVHDCGGATTYVHALYDDARDTLLERYEFFNISPAEALSPRFGGRYFQGYIHDCAVPVQVFCYDPAPEPGIVRIRELLAVRVKAYAYYTDGWRTSHASGNQRLGPSTLITELDHCVFDLRGATFQANAFNFGDAQTDQFLTNSIVISDSGLPLASICVKPRDGHVLHLDGTVLLNSAQTAQWLDADYSPKLVAGSPLIGKAVASPPGCHAAWGDLSDIGRFQSGGVTPPPPPPPPPVQPNVPQAITDLHIALDNFVTQLHYSIAKTQRTKVYAALLDLGGKWSGVGHYS
jgi:hypothetical protein